MRTRTTMPCTVACSRLAVLALLAAAIPQASLMAQEIPYERYRLENGLTVILHEDHRLPLVAVNIWYYVGSKDEPPGRSGFAHLFEHLMFMGTERVPYPEFDRRIEAGGGSNNATTSNDRTNYFEYGPRELLETFLFLEADRMEGLGRAITQEKLDTQRGVVRNERRQRFENRPYGKVHLEIPKRIYPPGHPYHHTVIGSHEDLERATLEDVRNFFETFYHPANASLVIAGDFDPGEARRLVAKYFGPIPPGPAIERAHPPQPKLEGEIQVELTDTVELPLTVLVWHSPPFYKPGDADLDVVAHVLGGGKSSRLYRSLVYEKKLAQDISVYQLSRLLGSEFRIFVYARPGVDLETLEKEIDAEIEKIRKEGPAPREVERARNAIESMFWREVESLHDRADLLNRYQFYFGDPGAIRKDRARYEQVTEETARRWAEEILKPDARLRLRVIPAKRPEPQPAAEGAGAQAPATKEEGK